MSIQMTDTGSSCQGNGDGLRSPSMRFCSRAPQGRMESQTNLVGLKLLCKPTNFMEGEDLEPTIKEVKRGESLSITELESVASEVEALAYNLQNKEYLDELALEWGDNHDDAEKARFILTALKPHTNLRRLTIKNFNGMIFPDWVGSSTFDGLVTLHLWNCMNCISLPPLGKLPSLVHLSVKKFYRLETVGPEFYGEISSDFTPFQTLKILQFEELPQWRTWDTCELEGGAFPILQELCLGKCPQLLWELPTKLPRLQRLEILDCQELIYSLPQLSHISKLKLQNYGQVKLTRLADLCSLTSLDFFSNYGYKTFPPDLQRLTSLTDLRIAGRHNIGKLKFPRTLQTLYISHLPGDVDPLLTVFLSCDYMQSDSDLLESIPASITSLRIGGFKDLLVTSIFNCPVSFGSLQYLSIHDCCFESPCFFPLGGFPVLKYLQIIRCYNMQLLGIQIQSHDEPEICLRFLNKVVIAYCPDFVHFWGKGLVAPNLRTLSITHCKKLMSIPVEMLAGLTSLQSLSLRECLDFGFFPEEGLPPSLNTLCIRSCRLLMFHWKQWKLDKLVGLKRLVICGCEYMECFPEQGWLPASLTSLSINHFSNLTSLVGEGFRHLTSLQELEIFFCEKLRSLPEEGLPPSLQFLSITCCPLLIERCQRGTGEYWPKISHIPRIHV